MNQTTTGELAIFCENVRLLRKYYGYSKKKMAKICHINPETLTKLEQMLMPPGLRVHIVFYIAQYFGLKPHQLFRPLIVQKGR
ncbi:MAG: helix-turn-helix domain-containing protein [Oscillospiraceae bacterium]|jgi:DNA-binding XRE family transcriptional regulator